MNCFDNANLRSLAGRVLASMVFALGAGGAFLPDGLVSAAEDKAQAVVRTAFGEDCEPLIVEELALARREVLVAIYSLTRRNINSALVKAVKRGATVTLKYDARQAELDSMKESISYLKKNGVQCIPVRIGDEHGAMHHKFTIIDRKRVLTGSYNYTVPATVLNYENVVSLESPEIAGQFVTEFDRIKDK